MARTTQSCLVRFDNFQFFSPFFRKSPMAVVFARSHCHIMRKFCRCLNDEKKPAFFLAENELRVGKKNSVANGLGKQEIPGFFISSNSTSAASARLDCLQVKKSRQRILFKWTPKNKKLNHFDWIEVLIESKKLVPNCQSCVACSILFSSALGLHSIHEVSECKLNE